MKKTVAGALLAGVLLRLAVLAGAGDALAARVRALGLDERLVTAALELELGGALPGAPADPAGEAPPEGDAEAEPEPETEAAEPASGPRLIPVTPAPGAEAPAPEAPAPEAQPVPQAVSLAGGAAEVQNRTAFDLDLKALAAEGLALTLPAEGPQVLIFHTHSSEAYTQDEFDRYEPSDPYRTEDPRYSVIRVGDALAAELEAAGLMVLHDREIYDYPSYTGSYSRSGAAVERYLAEYPGIRVVIDVHRDAIGSGDVVYKTQATLDGKSSAQVMLVVGTGENGLYHPAWRENLKLALYLQNAAGARWPTLTRPIELVSERYNQQLCTGMLILEVGSTGNTLREAVLAAQLFGQTAGPALAALVEQE